MPDIERRAATAGRRQRPLGLHRFMPCANMRADLRYAAGAGAGDFAAGAALHEMLFAPLAGRAWAGHLLKSADF